MSSYKEAIWSLLLKILEFTTLEKAYLHTTNGLNIPEDFLEKHGIKEPVNPVKILELNHHMKVIKQSLIRDNMIVLLKSLNCIIMEIKIMKCAFAHLMILRQK